MSGNCFKAIIDNRSSVSIFTVDLQKIFGERKVVIRDMVDNERYLDYNKRSVEFLGHQFVRSKEAEMTVSKVRVLEAPNRENQYSALIA